MLAVHRYAQSLVLVAGDVDPDRWGILDCGRGLFLCQSFENRRWRLAAADTGRDHLLCDDRLEVRYQLGACEPCAESRDAAGVFGRPASKSHPAGSRYRGISDEDHAAGAIPAD